MLEPTNYLNNLNKRIEISSSEIGNVQLKESFVLNSRRNALDFSTISSYLNDVIVTSYSTLCSAPRYPKDAVGNGISGMTIVTWLESDGNNKFNEDVFWFKSDNPDVDGRPCTIKESIQHIWSNLTPLITQERQNSVDLSPLENALSCLETKVDRLKADNFGESFILNCEPGWTKQTWPVSKHVYEILTQLTTGHDISEIEGLNNVSAPLYPDLNWSIALEDLLDVDVTSVPPASGDSLIWNEESGNWQPGNSDVKYITELRDVNTADYSLQENDVLVWNPTAKDDQAAQDGEEGAWVPVASSSLFEGSSVQYIDDLLDVETNEVGHGHVLTWDENYVDNTDPNNTAPGAWVPMPLPEPPSGNDDVFGASLCANEVLNTGDILIYREDCQEVLAGPQVPGWHARNRYSGQEFALNFPYASPGRAGAGWMSAAETSGTGSWDDNIEAVGQVAIASRYNTAKGKAYESDVYSGSTLANAIALGKLPSFAMSPQKLIESLIGSNFTGPNGVINIVNDVDSAGENVALYDGLYHTSSEIVDLQADVDSPGGFDRLEVNTLSSALTNFISTRIKRISIDSLLDVDTTINPASDGDLLVWDSSVTDTSEGNNSGSWVPKSASELGLDGTVTPFTKNYEQCHLGTFTKEVPYSGSGYQVGPGESPVMFLFKNNSGAALQLGDFSFSCTEMYSTQIEFSFVKMSFGDLVINQYQTISDPFVMGKQNVDVNTNDQGIGVFEGDLGSVSVGDKEYFGLLLNTYEKTGLDNSNFFLNLEASN
jgi:hypothetical protein